MKLQNLHEARHHRGIPPVLHQIVAELFDKDAKSEYPLPERTSKNMVIEFFTSLYGRPRRGFSQGLRYYEWKVELPESDHYGEETAHILYKHEDNRVDIYWDYKN